MSEANWSVPGLSGLRGWFPLRSAPTNQCQRPLRDAGVVVKLCTWWQETKRLGLLTLSPESKDEMNNNDKIPKKQKPHNPRIISPTNKLQTPWLWLFTVAACIQMLKTKLSGHSTVISLPGAGRETRPFPQTGRPGYRSAPSHAEGGCGRSPQRTTKTAKWLMSHLSIKCERALLFVHCLMLVLNVSAYFYGLTTYFQDFVFCDPKLFHQNVMIWNIIKCFKSPLNAISKRE